MRLVLLLPFVSTLASVSMISAAPMDMEKAIPVPGGEPLTLQLIGPSSVPNVNAPVPAAASAPTGVPQPNAKSLSSSNGVGSMKPKGLPALPMRRSVSSSGHYNTIKPRLIKNADYEVSPNSTINQPSLAETASKEAAEKRAYHPQSGRKAPPPRSARYSTAGRPEDRQTSHAHSAAASSQGSSEGSGLLPGLSSLPAPSSSDSAAPGSPRVAAASPGGAHSSPERPGHPTAPQHGGASAAGPAPGSPYEATSKGLRTAGSTPDGASSLFYSLPLGSIPSTPLTSPDSGAEDTVTNVPSEAEAAQSEIPATPIQGKSTATPPQSPAPTAQPKQRRSTATNFVSHFARDLLNASPRLAKAFKRHSLALSTDPFLPPKPNAEGRLPADRNPDVGFVNVDSNRQPEPVPKELKVPKPGNNAGAGATDAVEDEKKTVPEKAKRYVELDSVAVTTTYFPQSTPI